MCLNKKKNITVYYIHGKRTEVKSLWKRNLPICIIDSHIQTVHYASPYDNKARQIQP